MHINIERNDKGQLHPATYWYELVIQLPRDDDSMGMKNGIINTWLLHLRLALCYDRLGQHEKGNHHNETSLSFYPSHPIPVCYIITLISKICLAINVQITSSGSVSISPLYPLLLSWIVLLFLFIFIRREAYLLFEKLGEIGVVVISNFVRHCIYRHICGFQ